MYLRAFPKKVFNFVFIIWRVPWSAFEYHCLRTTVFNKAWLQSNPFESMWSLLLHHHKGASSSPSCSRWSPPSLSAQSPLLQRLHLSVALLWERSSGGWGSAAPSILHPLLSTCAAGQRWWSRPYFTWSKFLRHSYIFSLSSGFWISHHFHLHIGQLKLRRCLRSAYGICNSLTCEVDTSSVIEPPTTPSPLLKWMKHGLIS